MSNFSKDQRNRGTYAEAYKWYVAQLIQQIDAEIGEKGHF
jgi:hypothetical protein